LEGDDDAEKLDFFLAYMFTKTSIPSLYHLKGGGMHDDY